MFFFIEPLKKKNDRKVASNRNNGKILSYISSLFFGSHAVFFRVPETSRPRKLANFDVELRLHPTLDEPDSVTAQPGA